MAPGRKKKPTATEVVKEINVEPDVYFQQKRKSTRTNFRNTESIARRWLLV